MTKNLRKKTEQRENMERIRNSRGIPLTFDPNIIILSECKKDVTMNRFDGYIQTIHRKKP